MTPTERLNQLKQEYAQSQDKERFDEFVVKKLVEAEKQIAELQALLKPLADWTWEGEL